MEQSGSSIFVVVDIPKRKKKIGFSRVLLTELQWICTKVGPKKPASMAWQAYCFQYISISKVDRHLYDRTDSKNYFGTSIFNLDTD